MNKLQLAVLVFVGLVLVDCHTLLAESKAKATVDVKFCAPEFAKDDCLKTGGYFGMHGMSGTPSCLCKTKDAGAVCFKGSECEGQCIVENAPCKQGKRGKCSVYNPTFGCRCMYDRDGKIQQICVD